VIGEDMNEIDGVAEDKHSEQEPNEGVTQDILRGGRWIHKITGSRLGGEEGLLEFTVVGYVFLFYHFQAEVHHLVQNDNSE